MKLLLKVNKSCKLKLCEKKTPFNIEFHSSSIIFKILYFHEEKKYYS